jgi:drug/metabolite transporter (DMT)-like permease
MRASVAAAFEGAALRSAGAPALFVLLWSTGFIAAKAGLPYAEPMTFLALRFVLVCALMVPAALLLRAAWPGARAAAHVAVVGVLMHGAYLGGVFASIHHGLPAGVSALIVGLQPVLTACVVGKLLGERVAAMQWAGLVLGLAGVVLVLYEKLAFEGVTLFATSLSVLALLGITAGTLYQKRFCSAVDLRSGGVIQYLAAGLVVGALALVLETREIVWAAPFVAAISWSVLVLSIVSISLLYWLIRHGAAARIASLFFLVPPVTAVMAAAIFGEALHATALAGMALAAIGVALVQWGQT